MDKNDGTIVALIADLDQPDKRKIRAAVNLLIPLCADSTELTATLTRLLNDPQRINPWPVAYVLGHLPQPAARVIQTLLDGLDHPEPDIRWAIALLLVRMAKVEEDIVERLIDLCASGNRAQKRMAIYCLRDLNLTGADSLQPLLQGLRDQDPTVRVAAAIGLKARPDIDAAGRRMLLQCFMDDGDFRVRNAAAVTLAHLGSPSEEFIRALRKAHEGANPHLKKVAASALATIKKRSAPSGS